MRLTAEFFDRLSSQRERQFDELLAKRLAARYGIAELATQEDGVRWISQNRLLLARDGVRSQKHISDHLEMMIIHGSDVVDQPYYRSVMSEKFLSQEEKARKLRKRYLKPVTPALQNG